MHDLLAKDMAQAEWIPSQMLYGAQALFYERPDRLVFSFINIQPVAALGYTWGLLPNTFQVELFTAPRVLPVGSIRMTWESVGVQAGVYGVSSGRAPMASGGLAPLLALVGLDDRRCWPCNSVAWRV